MIQWIRLNGTLKQEVADLKTLLKKKMQANDTLQEQFDSLYALTSSLREDLADFQSHIDFLTAELSKAHAKIEELSPTITYNDACSGEPLFSVTAPEDTVKTPAQ